MNHFGIPDIFCLAVIVAGDWSRSVPNRFFELGEGLADRGE
jgi:hypothetical protein